MFAHSGELCDNEINLTNEVDAIAIRIVTDSTCDLSPEDQARLDVQVAPLTVQINGQSYLDGIEITNEQFYDALDRCDELPTTSQIPPQTFIEIFRKHLEAGDDVVGIFISGDISGTYHSACIARDFIASEQPCSGRLYIVDSRSATMSLALLVAEASKCRDAGFSAPQIAAHIAMLAKKVRFLAAVNSLKYLRMGGRVSAATAVIGEVLGVKPIVSVINGTVHAVGRARGMPAAIKAMLDKALTNLPDLRYAVVFGHSCAPEMLEQTIAYMKGPLKLVNWLTCSLGSVMGTYSGRGAVGLAYIEE